MKTYCIGSSFIREHPGVVIAIVHAMAFVVFLDAIASGSERAYEWYRNGCESLVMEGEQ